MKPGAAITAALRAQRKKDVMRLAYELAGDPRYPWVATLLRYVDQ